MQMIKKIKRIFLLTLSFLMLGQVVLVAQTTDALGTYTPYSLFGIGDIERGGSSLNRGMGGIGVGVRDNRFINFTNPAAITERDTLSFMMDLGLYQKNFYNTDGKVKSAYNTFNMNNIVFTAPIYKKSALIVGIVPYSNIGYKFETIELNQKLVADYGEIKYQKYGEGGISKFFLGAAMNLSKNISLGAEFIYYFGALDRYNNVLFASESSLRSIYSGWDYSIGAISSKLGLQYFGNVSEDVQLTVGATYNLKTNLKGVLTDFTYVGADTISNNVIEDAKIAIPSEFAAGFSLKKKDKWLLGFDYKMQDWKNSKWSDVSGSSIYTPAVASSYAIGGEFIPNKYDVRYYLKRVTYRMGLYYDKTYVNVNNGQINAFGLTFGMSLPINRWYNAINWAVDFGQRGSLKNINVRERYVQFQVNFSLHDIWFRKHRYD